MSDPVPQVGSRFDYSIIIRKTEHTVDGREIPYQDIKNDMYNMPYDAMAYVDAAMHEAQGKLIEAAGDKAAGMAQARSGGKG